MSEDSTSCCPGEATSISVCGFDPCIVLTMYHFFTFPAIYILAIYIFIHLNSRKSGHVMCFIFQLFKFPQIRPCPVPYFIIYILVIYIIVACIPVIYILAVYIIAIYVTVINYFLKSSSEDLTLCCPGDVTSVGVWGFDPCVIPTPCYFSAIT